MMKKHFAIFCIVCLFASQNTIATANEGLIHRIEAAVPAGFSGQIVISDADGILFSSSFGMADREAGLPVTDNTLFDIGSATKTYTATALLLLASRDKLNLDMTLSDWFEDLPDATGSIALHQLLSHTSGLPQYSGDDDEPCDRQCFDDWLASAVLEFPPGEKFQYSNPGYSALTRVIEKASNQDYEMFIRVSLVDPLVASDGRRNHVTG
jgi:CubicO group peptidase (beta-lactamase class C family)